MFWTECLPPNACVKALSPCGTEALGGDPEGSNNEVRRVGPSRRDWRPSKKRKRPRAPSPPGEDTEKAASRQKALSRSRPAWHPDLGLPVSGIGRKHHLLFKPSGLWCFKAACAGHRWFCRWFNKNSQKAFINGILSSGVAGRGSPELACTGSIWAGLILFSLLVSDSHGTQKAVNASGAGWELGMQMGTGQLTESPSAWCLAPRRSPTTSPVSHSCVYCHGTLSSASNGPPALSVHRGNACSFQISLTCRPHSAPGEVENPTPRVRPFLHFVMIKVIFTLVRACTWSVLLSTRLLKGGDRLAHLV